MLIGQDFNRYLAEETISIDLVSTQKPEEPPIGSKNKEKMAEK
ncbi:MULTISPECIES: hypothetical protein [Microcystis]|jgi:hypothetical protein|nr:MULTISPECIES: hypothetical protein [Microcystis]